MVSVEPDRSRPLPHLPAYASRGRNRTAASEAPAARTAPALVRFAAWCNPLDWHLWSSRPLSCQCNPRNRIWRGFWETHSEQVRLLAALDRSRTCLCERHTWLSEPWFGQREPQDRPTGPLSVKRLTSPETHPRGADFVAQGLRKRKPQVFVSLFVFCFSSLAPLALPLSPHPDTSSVYH